MVESVNPMEQAKVKIKFLTPTQESIEETATLFLKLSVEGQSKMLFDLWQHRFKKATPDQMLSLIYLLSHIILEGNKDNYALKKLFKSICKPSLEKTYKCTLDDNNRKVLRDIVLVWQNRRTFKNAFLEELLNSLEQLEIKLKSRPTFLLDSLKDVVPEKCLVDLERKLKNLSDWEEKIELTEKPLTAIANKLANYNEIEVELQLAVLEEAIKQRELCAKLVKEAAEHIIAQQKVIEEYEEKQIKEFTKLMSGINSELSI